MKRFLYLLLLPSLFWGNETRLYGIEATLDTYMHNNLQMTKMLWQSRRDDGEFGLDSAFIYTKKQKYSVQKGSFTLFSRMDDDGVLIPFLNYTYSAFGDQKGDNRGFDSHNINAGFKSMVDMDFLDFFAGIGVGGSFNEMSINQSNLKYSYLFADAQLGIGKELDFFKDRLLITPLSYVEYDYVYQKGSDLWQSEHIHSLSLLLGTEIDVGILQSDYFLMSFSFFGFYKHLFLGDRLETKNHNRTLQYSRTNDSGYAGAGLNFRYRAIFFNLDCSSEFAKNAYSIQTLARIGMEF